MTDKCEQKSITQKEFCNREFQVMHEKLIELQESIKNLRNLVIYQFGAIGMALIGYVLQQIN